MLRRAVFCALFGVVAPACGDDSATGTGAGGAGGGAAGAPAPGGQNAGGAGGVTPDDTPFDATVTSYAIAADTETLVQSDVLVLDVDPPGGSCFSIPSQLSPTSAAFDDIAARTSSFSNATFSACAAAPLDMGPHTLSDTVTLDQTTYFGLDVGLSKKQDVGGTTFTYLLSWVGGCDDFGPCDDDPSRLVHFSYDIAHPSGTTVLCPGTLTEGETSTHCELAGTPAPTYSAFAWMADPGWQRSPFVSTRSVDVVFYEVPGSALAQAIDAPSYAAFLDWASARFGPLPYGPELRFAGGPTAWLGFEHPANIVLYDQLDTIATDYANAPQHVAMHETVHQWSGDAATIATPQDFAWKEAIAEYVTYVFEDEMRPIGESAATLEYWDAIAVQAAYHVRPTDEPPVAVEDFYGDVYGAGPMVLFVQLEDLIGRDAVMAAIASFLEGGGARAVSDLQAALETASGEDLSEYFDAWVFGAGAPAWPMFAVDTTDNLDGTLTVTVTQTQAGAPYPCEVEVDGATQSAFAVADFGLAPASAQTTVTIPFAEPVVGTSVDPGHRIVDLKVGLSAAKRPVYIL